MPTAEQITTFVDEVPGNPWVRGGPVIEDIEICAYDAGWPALFERVAADLRAALGGSALALGHVGSTAVPGLAAKPVIDVDLTVADNGEEDAYVPLLEPLGYRIFAAAGLA